jgi:hypothetical protein
MLPRPAIVATVRDAADVLESFIAYHLAIGFAHIFLFFDDPADPFAGTLAGRPAVTAVRCDAALRARWANLRGYAQNREHIATEVMARQLLNCELAIGMAAAAGLDWILHIDSDELFFCKGGGAPEHFAALDFRGTRTAVYMNYEALPEREEIGDYFREVSLFKVNFNKLGGVRFTPAQMALFRQAHFPDPNFNFHLYGNGKAAARVDGQLVPVTVHEFARVLPDGSLDRTHEICGDSQLILHYPNCGLSRFLTKYRTLGNFADKWFGVGEVFAFHREARDVVALGDPEKARRFYLERVMRHPAEDVDGLIHHGLLERITGPSELLAGLGAAP